MSNFFITNFNIKTKNRKAKVRLLIGFRIILV